jgi:hypothetical protein
MGTLGFNGALLAADLVARALLGPYWWTPLIAIAIATLCCLRPALAFGPNFARPTDFGPLADEFYSAFAGQPSRVGREQMLDDLGKAFANNARRFTAKRRALQAALIVLAFGLSAAALLIGLSCPSKMRRTDETQTQSRQTSVRRTRAAAGTGAHVAPTPETGSILGPTRRTRRHHQRAPAALAAPAQTPGRLLARHRPRDRALVVSATCLLSNGVYGRVAHIG